MRNRRAKSPNPREISFSLIASNLPRWANSIWGINKTHSVSIEEEREHRWLCQYFSPLDFHCSSFVLTFRRIREKNVSTGESRAEKREANKAEAQEKPFSALWSEILMHYEYDGGPRTSSCLHSFLRSTVCEKDIHHSPNNAKQPEVEPKTRSQEEVSWENLLEFDYVVRSDSRLGEGLVGNWLGSRWLIGGGKKHQLITKIFKWIPIKC